MKTSTGGQTRTHLHVASSPRPPACSRLGCIQRTPRYAVITCTCCVLPCRCCIRGATCGGPVAVICFVSAAAPPPTSRSDVSRWPRPCCSSFHVLWLCLEPEKFINQVVFSDPYMECDMNRWTSPELDEAAAELRTDVALRLTASRLKDKFMTSCEVHA